MQTLSEVNAHLETLKQQGGEDAVAAWISEHGASLPEDVRDEVIFQHSTDAFIGQMESLAPLAPIVEEAADTLDKLQAERAEIAAEIEKQEIEERLG